MCRLAAELEMRGAAIDGTDLLDALVTSVFLLDQDLHVNYLNAAVRRCWAWVPSRRWAGGSPSWRAALKPCSRSSSAPGRAVRASCSANWHGRLPAASIGSSTAR